MTENEAKNFHLNTDMFGQYAKIPTGCSGDLHIYKVITRFQSNGYCDVAIIVPSDSTLHKEITDILNVIHCGVDESKVIRVALKDCQIVENKAIKELQQYREIGTVEECQEAMERQIPKKPLGGADIAGNEYMICPHCSAIVEDGEWRADYCPDCGQAIQWKNLEGMEDERD